jgi:hypothetical protein
MPDKTKLQVLEDRGVRLVKTCGTCKHSSFHVGRPWGECALATYQHEKHAGERPMPAHLSFSCPSFEYGEKHLLELGEYTQIIPWVNPLPPR